MYITPIKEKALQENEAPKKNRAAVILGKLI